MNTAIHHYYGGMGAGPSTGQTVAAIGTTVTEAVVPTLVGPSVATMLGIATTTAIPLVGAAIAGISIAVEALIANSGCGESCIVTSQWANQAAAQLDQNISAYFAVPIPRPKSVQQIAMANFQVVWNKLVQLCSQPGLSTAGQDCINDRKDGACKWKAAPPAYPGEPAAGSCWNWWNGYYYPIANDPNVYNDGAISGVLGSGIDSNLLLVLAGVAGVLAVVALS